ncbi:MAG TPA: peptidylprolyl isomerase [Sphaerochaeta sp.]|nr:peptidylprolyl isomerase [Sphaerochaeta sp.]HOR79358.1 peptidylprolyl isomerase [Sphaerochaeta sp.]HPK63641.1 peptidylprolyl isomerase [Sphaerochaeta sp.]
MDTKTLKDGLYAVMHTSKGDILLALEYKKTPMTVANFVGLAEGSLNKDKPFYDGLKFHRVIANFMIQGGCPLGTGTGGPGYKFGDEFDPSLKHDRAGILSMANSGPGTNGSQFFITHVETPWLDNRHSVFGHVVEGQKVVDSIAQGDTIKKVEILRVGSDAEAFKVTKQIFTSYIVESENKRKKVLEEARANVEAELKNRYPEAIRTKTGLRYVVKKKGDGERFPKMGTRVKVHYQGSLLDGRIFDSSIQRGEPTEFRVGEVIEGWNEALVTMSAGEERTLIIPPELGYGEMGYPGIIPPNSYLIFEVHLLSF